MIDEQRLLDDMKLNSRICGGSLDGGAILAIIRRQPTVDAVPVVRCKDCVHHRKQSAAKLGLPIAMCRKWYNVTGNDDFCSFGEREKQ